MAGLHGDLEHLHTSYNAFGDRNNELDESDNESPPQFHESGHPSTWYQTTNERHMPKLDHSKPHEHDPPIGGVIIHTVAEENKSRWSHIEDLDSFFKNIYTYHQKHGFYVMILQVNRKRYTCCKFQLPIYVVVDSTFIKCPIFQRHCFQLSTVKPRFWNTGKCIPKSG